MRTLTPLLLLLCLIACTPLRPLRPGTASTQSGTSPTGTPEFRAQMQQPENPAQSATQTFERTLDTDLPLSAGSQVVTITTAPPAKPGAKPTTTEQRIILTKPAVQHTHLTEKSGTLLGAAQKDLTRELAAKLSSMRPLLWVGLILFLAGVATLVYPPLRLLVNSLTTSLAISAAGLALMILPTLIAGNETLIFLVIGGLLAAWFIAHRHGYLKGLLGDPSAPATLAQPSPPPAQPG